MNMQKINEISKARYGHDVTEISPLTALWLAEFIFDELGKDAYKTISKIREKAGQMILYPEYNSRLFNAKR